MLYFLFDIGGTKTRLGLSEDGESLSFHEMLPTPQEFARGVSLMANFMERNGLSGKIQAAAGGIAGPLNREKDELINAPNLPLWIGKKIKEELQNLVGSPVFLENDTALVGLGEAVVGGGQGRRIVAYLGIGTGVGGVRIVNGKIDENSLGFEPGHQIIDFSSRFPDSCGSFGHLEAYVSGSAFARMHGKQLEAIYDQKTIDQLALMLAYGVNNTLVYWSPDVVVLGGSVMSTVSIDKVSSHLKNICTIFPTLPPLVPATLGDVGGLHGALVYLRQKLATTG